jgi:hypothetical protein
VKLMATKKGKETNFFPPLNFVVVVVVVVVIV